MTTATLPLIQQSAPPKISYLLTVGSDAKTVKGEKLGFLTGIQYLAPSTVSGIVNLCPKASEGCKIACLNTAGRAAFDTHIEIARINKTIWYVRYKPQYWQKLVANIKSLIRKAEKLGLTPVIRLNGTSDILWERAKIKGTEFDGLTIFEAFPEIQFYDYTKYPRAKRQNLPDNYSLTFSLSEDNHADAMDWLADGGNVAVVFDIKTFPGKTLPETFWGYRVIDADGDDARFLDP